MNRAYRKVVSNGGSGCVDSMEAKDLLPYLKLHNDELRNSILNGKYKPMPVRRVEIPKDNGKTCKLGIPTLVDRVIRQSISQVLSQCMSRSSAREAMASDRTAVHRAR